MLHNADMRGLQALFTLKYLANQVIFFSLNEWRRSEGSVVFTWKQPGGKEPKRKQPLHGFTGDKQEELGFPLLPWHGHV